MSINPVDIVIHLINIGVLYIILRFLVYKPVLDFIKARRDKVEAEFADAEAKIKEAEEKKAEYEALIADADKKAEEISEREIALAREESDRILAEAEEKVAALVESGKKKVRAENAAALADMQKEVKDLSIDIAERILNREVRGTDNDRIVEDFFANGGNR